MKPTLIFVYNADSGFFNALTDFAHKILAPQTYSCRLCALTYSNFGMRHEWKLFIESLAENIEFLHADQLKARYKIKDIALPAILVKTGENIEIFITADAINACQNLAELKTLVQNKILENSPPRSS